MSLNRIIPHPSFSRIKTTVYSNARELLNDINYIEGKYISVRKLLQWYVEIVGERPYCCIIENVCDILNIVIFRRLQIRLFETRTTIVSEFEMIIKSLISYKLKCANLEPPDFKKLHYLPKTIYTRKYLLLCVHRLKRCLG